MSDIHHLRASSWARYVACPGSYAAQLGIPDQKSEIATQGDAIHACIEECVGAKDHDEVIARHKLEEYDAAFVRSALSTLTSAWPHDAWYKSEAEVELAISSGNMLVTGHPDLLVYMVDGTVHVWDWKTGPDAVPTADINRQVRMYALLVYASMGRCYDRFVLHIYARGNYPQHSEAVYEVNEDDLAAMWMEAEACIRPDAKRIVGTHCRYCKASGTTRCPESCAVVAQPEKAARLDVIQGNAAASVVQAWTPEERGAWIQRWKMLKDIAEKVEDELKTLAEQGEVEGFGVRFDRPRSIKDSKQLWAVMRDIGVSAERFVESANVPMSELEAMAYEAHVENCKMSGVKPMSKKDCRAMLDEKLEPITERKKRKVLIKR